VAQWHRTLKGDTGLRATGTALLAISYVCIRSVSHRHAVDPVHWSTGIILYALTAMGFLSASLGSAMVLLGHHLFDRVEISERWRPRSDNPPNGKDGPFLVPSAITALPPRANERSARSFICRHVPYGDGLMTSKNSLRSSVCTKITC
jgi:hypothetical protein